MPLCLRRAWRFLPAPSRYFFDGKDMVESNEIIPYGCLAQVTSDNLVAVLIYEFKPAISMSQVVAAFLSVIISPPVFGCVVWGIIPLNSPALGVVRSNILHTTVPACALFFGVSYMLVVRKRGREGVGRLTRAGRREEQSGAERHAGKRRTTCGRRTPPFVHTARDTVFVAPFVHTCVWLRLL